MLGVFLPFYVYDYFNEQKIYLTESGYISLWLSVLSTALAIIVSRRMTPFPGASAVSMVLPSFTFTYGLVMLGLLGLRVDYSTVILLSSFGMSLVTQSMLVILAGRRSQIDYYVVPGGRIERLTTQPEFAADLLRDATLPKSGNAIVVADLHFSHDEVWERMLAEAALKGIPVYHYKNVLEDITGQVRIEHLSENSFGSLIPNVAWVKSKRIFDLAVCAILLPILAIPLLLTAAAIKIDSPGPVIFRQERVGYRGKVFKVFKFRTMRAVMSQSQAVDSRSLAKTKENDDRITRLGRLLRRTRIDELPQIFNIIKGEMSWIGPRPEALALSQWYSEEIPFYAYRHIVRPGITGWAQVNQGHVTDLEDIDKKLQYDFFYIKNFSYWIDLHIAIRTIGIVFTGFGSK